MSENELKIIDRRMPDAQVVKEEVTTDIVLVAMQKGYDPAFIEKMMDLAERNEKAVARRAFYEAVANFKAEAPPVKKDKYNKYFDSWYTSLGNLLETYNPVLGKHGLSISFPTPKQTETTMTVECRLSHRLGHSDSISLTAPIDQAAIGKESGKRSRNPIQDIKSTFTYLRSATAEAILGVTGTEASAEDDDGNAAGESIQYITADQQTDINDKIKEYAIPEADFLSYLAKTMKIEKIESVETIPAKGYAYALAVFKAKASALSKKVTK